jgi:hypothetical protein
MGSQPQLSLQQPEEPRSDRNRDAEHEGRPNLRAARWISYRPEGGLHFMVLNLQSGAAGLDLWATNILLTTTPPFAIIRLGTARTGREGKPARAAENLT